jgi:hypothetical protein
MPEKFFNQSGPSNHIEQTKLQTIEDVQFSLITEEDPDFETAITVNNYNGKKTPQELEKEAKNEIISTHWWLQEEWATKGAPKEQVSIKIDNLNIEMFNYGQELNPSQLEETKKILIKLSQASIPDQNSRVKYVAINDKDEMNANNGENKRGYAFRNSKMVALYPRAMSPEPHRIPDTSSFAGTLAHEFGHMYTKLGDQFVAEWMEKFGWEILPEDKIDYSAPSVKIFTTDKLDRCITDYAQFSPEEDICESLSAVINNPAVLDAEKRAFIEERWFKEEPIEKEIIIDKKTSKDIKMPRVPDKIKYKVIDGGGILVIDDEEDW